MEHHTIITKGDFRSLIIKHSVEFFVVLFFRSACFYFIFSLLPKLQIDIRTEAKYKLMFNNIDSADMIV